MQGQESDPSGRAKAYARIRYRLLLVEMVLSLGFLALIQALGLSHRLAGWAAELQAPWLIILAYLTVFGAVYTVIFLPLNYYRSFILEHAFGLSRMTRKQWYVRELKRVALSSIMMLLVVEAGYALLRHAPQTWVLWATLGWVSLSIVLARIFPTVLLPLFYKTHPLGSGQLVDRLLDLCRRIGLPALGVFKVDLGAETRKANAALTGWGKTRRVLLADTLMDQFSVDEIEGVLAHEMAHHRYHHIAKHLAIGTVGSWLAFSLTDGIGEWAVPMLGLSGMADIAGFPAVSLWFSLLGLLGLPILNAISRHFEWQADRFAMVTSLSPKAFASALRRLATLNLADPAPPAWVVWLFYDHPPISERIHAAEQASP